MLEISLMVLVLMLGVAVIIMAVWVNSLATGLNAVGQRLWQLEQRSAAKVNDPVANFKTL